MNSKYVSESSLYSNDSAISGTNETVRRIPINDGFHLVDGDTTYGRLGSDSSILTDDSAYSSLGRLKKKKTDRRFLLFESKHQYNKHSLTPETVQRKLPNVNLIRNCDIQYKQIIRILYESGQLGLGFDDLKEPKAAKEWLDSYIKFFNEYENIRRSETSGHNKEIRQYLEDEIPWEIGDVLNRIDKCHKQIFLLAKRKWLKILKMIASFCSENSKQSPKLEKCFEKSKQVHSKLFNTELSEFKCSHSTSSTEMNTVSLVQYESRDTLNSKIKSKWRKIIRQIIKLNKTKKSGTWF